MHVTALEEAGRILVVDDNESNRDVLSRRLRRSGYVVDVAINGRQALDVIRQGDFDLILLDIMMPELNGYEVLEHLKSDEALRHVPVVMISAVDDIDSVVRCIEMGADDYLPKPFNPTLLKARVQAGLTRKRLHDSERIYARSLERELEIGRQIQVGFLPSALPQPDGWDIAARFQPAQQVAGDFYDAFEIGDDRVGLVIADVCGKGVGAALFMALFRSLIRAFSERAGRAPHSTGEDILVEAVAATNGYVRTVHKNAHTFASVFFAILEPRTGRLHYVNAGHLPPIVVDATGATRRLDRSGPAVGLASEAVYKAHQSVLVEGDVLVGFTDGVIEARDVARDFYTEERLVSLLSQPAASASEVLDRIEESVRDFSRESVPSDDLTLLAVQRL